MLGGIFEIFCKELSSEKFFLTYKRIPCTIQLKYNKGGLVSFMPFHSPVTTVSIFPHVFSRMQPETKEVYRQRYKYVKKCGSASVIAGVGISEGTQLAKDLLSSKLKAYGYKSLFAIALGPVIQFISLPFYVFTYGSKFRKFAIATTEIGAKISEGEMGIVNWAWIGADLLLFGEPVSITESSDFLIIHNETVGKLAETIEEFGFCEGER